MTDDELKALAVKAFGDGADKGTVRLMIDTYRMDPEGPKAELLGHHLMFPKIREMSDDERQASKQREEQNKGE